MSIELLIYAVIAGVLVFWLKNTLGARHGEERERPNPLTQIKPDAPKDTNRNTGRDMPQDRAADSVFGGFDFNAKPHEATQDEWAGLPVIDSAFAGLKMVAASDRNFDAKKFLSGAKDVFPLIVESFAAGDKDTLAQFLTPALYKNFARAIDVRTARGETVKTDIHAVREVKITEAIMRDKMAFVTVQFTADETCVVRNHEDVILSGDLNRVTELKDVWVFGRDTQSQDPTWFLYETRDDAQEVAPTIFPHSV